MTVTNKQTIAQDILTVIVLIWLDLVSKYLFFNQRIWADTFFLEPAMNRGISFSMDMSLSLVIMMTVIALGLFSFMYIKKIFPNIILILLIAGTMGNLYDRIVYDGVRDFFVIPHWFICNGADIFLFFGMIWACVYLLVIDKNKKSY